MGLRSGKSIVSGGGGGDGIGRGRIDPPPFPRGEVVGEAPRADPVAVQGDEADAVDPVEHALDLVIAPSERVTRARRSERSSSRAGLSPGSRSRKRIPPRTVPPPRGNRAVGLDEIGFFNVVSGKGQGPGPAAVIAEEDQSRRSPVETAGEMEGGFVRMIDQVEHGAVDRIRGGRKNPGGLVQHEMRRSSPACTGTPPHSTRSNREISRRWSDSGSPSTVTDPEAMRSRAPREPRPRRFARRESSLISTSESGFKSPSATGNRVRSPVVSLHDESDEEIVDDEVHN